MAVLSEVDTKVKKILSERWNVRLGNRPETVGDYLLDFESTTLQVWCDEYGEEKDSVIVRIFAPILFEVVLTDDLYKWVSVIGADYSFGHAAIYPNDDGTTGTLIFFYSILGDFLDADELNWAVGSVGFTADRLDDELKEMFGGKRTADLQ